MNAAQTVGVTQQDRGHRSFLQIMMSPTIDRMIAVVAVLPMIWSAYYWYHHFGLNLPVIYYWVATFVFVLTMVFRRPPGRITTNPWFWLLAFVNSYFPQAILPFMDRGRPLVSPVLSSVVAIAALLVTLWARLSLGRNIGLVPAQRELVMAGAYRWVRHPIYTGLMLSFVAVALRIYSPRNAALLAIATFWMILKSFVEESFLRADPRYAEYMTRVPARWIPFVT